MEKNREKNRENEENQRNNPVPLKTGSTVPTENPMKSVKTKPLPTKNIFCSEREKKDKNDHTPK